MSSFPPLTRPVLVFVEGVHDIRFLVGIAMLLRGHDPGLSDLAAYETAGKVIFIPTGGDLARWAHRFAPLALPELHLYDREVPPATAQRQLLVETVNRRPGCVGLLTAKRAVENYLHAEAIRQATGLDVEVSDEADVPERLARQTLAARGGPAWDEVPGRARKRLRYRAKVLLNTAAVAALTHGQLLERDPAGEVIGWLTTIRRLADA